MRKNIRAFSLILALILLTGCGLATAPPESQGETDAFTVDTTEEDSESDASKETETEPETRYEQPKEGGDQSSSETWDYTVNYVPVGERVFTDPSLLPEKEIICSAEELKGFCEQWDEFYDLDRGTMYPYMAGFRETIEAYDAMFWEGHDVIILGSTLCSGSIRHNVRAIKKDEETDDWVVEVERLIPEEMNAMIQTWFIVIEVPKGRIKNEEQLTVQWYEVGLAEESEKPKEIEVPLNAQYIRTGELAEYEGEPKRTFRVVRSASELDAYYEEFKEVYYLGHNETVYLDTTIGFLDACDRFDEAFWAEYDLVLATKVEGSGSIRHEVVNMVSTDGGSEWVINVRVISPGIQTCDMAFWYFLIEVPKGMIEETDTVTLEAVTDRKYAGIYDGDVQYIRTNAEECLPEGEEEELIILETKNQLTAYCDTYPFSAGFLAACEEYDEAFWEKNNLIVLVRREGSGSDRHEVRSIFQSELYPEDCWYLKVDRLVPGEDGTSTSGEAVWHMLIQISKEVLSAGDDVKVSYTDVKVTEKLLYNVQYVRTDNGSVESGDPGVVLLHSQEELDRYYQENKDRYALLWKDSYKGDSTNGFLNICEWNYTPVFWEQNDLVMIVLQEPNKWIRHEVEQIEWTTEVQTACELSVNCEITISKRTCRETDEPANWHILVAVPKGQVPGAEDVVLKFMEVCTESK